MAAGRCAGHPHRVPHPELLFGDRRLAARPWRADRARRTRRRRPCARSRAARRASRRPVAAPRVSRRLHADRHDRGRPRGPAGHRAGLDDPDAGPRRVDGRSGRVLDDRRRRDHDAPVPLQPRSRAPHGACRPRGARPRVLFDRCRARPHDHLLRLRRAGDQPAPGRHRVGGRRQRDLPARGLRRLPSRVRAGPRSRERTGLVFVTVPIAFARMPFGTLAAVAFFLLLFIAALASAVSMLELVVGFLSGALRWSRRRASAIAGTACFIAGIGTCLSFNLWAEWHPLRGVEGFRSATVFDLLDHVTSNVLLPLGGLGHLALRRLDRGRAPLRRGAGARPGGGGTLALAPALARSRRDRRGKRRADIRMARLTGPLAW